MGVAPLLTQGQVARVRQVPTPPLPLAQVGAAPKQLPATLGVRTSAPGCGEWLPAAVISAAAGRLGDAHLCVSVSVQVTPAGLAPQTVSGCPALSPASANGRKALSSSMNPGPRQVLCSAAAQTLPLQVFVCLCHMIWQLLAPPPLLQGWPLPAPPRW